MTFKENTYTTKDPIEYVTDFAKRVGSAKPSMLQDFETKKKTEIDFINGAIPPLAAKYKSSAPFNDHVCKIIHDAIQIHGATGVSQWSPLPGMYVKQRILRLADGPDEVHHHVVARAEVNSYELSNVRKVVSDE